MRFCTFPPFKPLIFKRLGNIKILYKLAAFLERLYSFKDEKTAKFLAALCCLFWAGLF